MTVYSQKMSDFFLIFFLKFSKKFKKIRNPPGKNEKYKLQIFLTPFKVNKSIILISEVIQKLWREGDREET